MPESSRLIALNVINDVLIKKRFLNLSIKERISYIDQKNKSFCVSLVFLTLENLIRIDYIISHFVEKKVKDKIINNILRLGVAQLLFCSSVPDRAAVYESVSLCDAFGKKGLKGFVNAVLRRISLNISDVNYPDKEVDPAEYLSISYSYPLWICKMYLNDYGIDFTEKMLSYKKSHSFFSARVKSGFQAPDDWVKCKYTDNVYHINDSLDISDLDEYKKGYIYPMSEASVLAIDAASIKKSDIILDVCAAPGGKSCYCAELGESVVSCDKYENRVNLIRLNAERMGYDNLETVCMDATKYNADFDLRFDVVICDVVCSALGLTYRKPDIKEFRQANDIDEIVIQQKMILDNCKNYVAHGGVLLYSTCTINKRENDDMIQSFLNENTEYCLEPFSNSLNDHFCDRSKSGMLQIYPHIDGVDGFFIAKLRRK